MPCLYQECSRARGLHLRSDTLRFRFEPRRNPCSRSGKAHWLVTKRWCSFVLNRYLQIQDLKLIGDVGHPDSPLLDASFLQVFLVGHLLDLACNLEPYELVAVSPSQRPGLLELLVRGVFQALQEGLGRMGRWGSEARDYLTLLMKDPMSSGLARDIDSSSRTFRLPVSQHGMRSQAISRRAACSASAYPQTKASLACFVW